MMTKIVILMLLVGSLTSCVEKYWPSVDKYNQVIVIDGTLTDCDDPVIVNLSYSSSINKLEFTPISDGVVYIIDNNQITLTFDEVEPGVYQSQDETFIPKTGDTYQLFVELPNGNKYESEICKLIASSPIDSLYGVEETRKIPNRHLPQQLVQFYLDNHSDISDTCYYLWKLNHTYKYQSSFNIDYTWEGEFIPFPVPDSLRTCWHNSQIHRIFTFTTKNLSSPVIKRFPLSYSTTDTKELSIRYSLLVSQLSLSKTAFDFWDSMRQQNDNMDNLYSQQPFQLRGNIRNTVNDEETVLGYFTVAGVTKKRIYINRPSLPFYYMICEPDYKSMGWIRFEPPQYWPIYLTMSNEGALGMATLEECFDCRLEGGSLTPPDFWEN